MCFGLDTVVSMWSAQHAQFKRIRIPEKPLAGSDWDIIPEVEEKEKSFFDECWKPRLPFYRISRS